MKALLDTQILFWFAIAPERIPAKARAVIEDGANAMHFSVVSIWEVAMKRALNRPDFTVEADALRDALLADDFVEVELASRHALPVRHLPPIHRDPFDRLLLSQASVEKLTFMTTDTKLVRYPGDILTV